MHVMREMKIGTLFFRRGVCIGFCNDAEKPDVPWVRLTLEISLELIHMIKYRDQVETSHLLNKMHFFESFRTASI